MNDILKTIFSLSVSGSILAFILFLGKPFLKSKISKAFSYYIWLLVLLRLIVPLAAPVNFMGTLFHFERPNVSDVIHAQTNSQLENKNVNANNQAAFSNAQTVSQKPQAGNTGTIKVPVDTQRPFSLWEFVKRNLVWIWVAGAIVSLGWFIMAYVFFSMRIRRSCVEPHSDDLAVFGQVCRNNRIHMACSSFATTPMLFGVLRPVIVLPQFAYVKNGMDKELLDILHHELTHYRRKDVLYKWLVVLVTSLHWFNPFMILIRREISRISELSCDEMVISEMSADEKQFYGNMLLSLASNKKLSVGILATTLCEDKKELRDRLINIKNYKKKPARTVTLTLVLAILLTGFAIMLGVAKRSALTENRNTNPVLTVSTNSDKTVIQNSVDDKWKTMFSDINFTNEWVAGSSRVVLFGSLNKDPDQGVAVDIDTSNNNAASRYLTPKKYGAIRAEKLLGASSAVQVSAPNGHTWIFSLYGDGFADKPEGGAYAGIWNQIDQSLSYVEGTVVSLMKYEDGTAALTLKVVANYHGGNDPSDNANSPYPVGSTQKFILQTLPGFTMVTGDDIVIYQTGVYPLSGSMDRFVGAVAMYYKTPDQLYHDKNGNSVSMPPQNYPTFNAVFNQSHPKLTMGDLKIGKLLIGESLADIRQEFGEPKIKTIVQGNGAPQWEYTDQKFTVGGDPVFMINVSSESIGSTPKGILVGSTEHEVRQAYPNAEWTQNGTQSFVQSYDSRGFTLLDIGFSISNGKVSRIIIENQNP